MNRRPVFKMPFKVVALMALAYATAIALVEMTSPFGRHQRIDLWQWSQLTRQCGDVLTVWWTLAASAYGLMRIMRYHPTVVQGYAKWLAGTPWRPGRPLPLGPPHLVWEDLVPAAMAAVLSPRPIFALMAFTFFYAVLAVFVTLGGRDRRWVPAMVAVAIGGVLIAWPNEWSSAVILLGVLIAGDVAVRRSLVDLPWATPVADAARAAAKSLQASQWILAPVPPPAPVAAGDAWTIVGVAAWCVYCAMHSLVAHDPRQDGAVLALAALVLAMAGLVRWAVYGGEHHPPISTWGRLWTGRLIIPGYDVAAAAPLGPAAVGVAVPVGLWLVGVPVAAAAGTAATLAVILRAGPSRRRWDLTGHHRIVQRRRTGMRRRSAIQP